MLYVKHKNPICQKIFFLTSCLQAYDIIYPSLGSFILSQGCHRWFCLANYSFVFAVFSSFLMVVTISHIIIWRSGLRTCLVTFLVQNLQKFRWPQRDSNPWPLRHTCNALLSSEATLLGAGQLVGPREKREFKQGLRQRQRQTAIIASLKQWRFWAMGGNRKWKISLLIFFDTATLVLLKALTVMKRFARTFERNHHPRMQKVHIRLSSVAQKRYGLNSLILLVGRWKMGRAASAEPSLVHFFDVLSRTTTRNDHN